MRSLRWLPALLLPLVVIVAGHAQDKKEQDKKEAELSSPYFPLLPGAEWTYRVGEGAFSYRVGKIEEINKTNAARIDFIINKRVISSEHVGVIKDGVVRFKFDGKEAKPPIRVLPLELKEGAEWSVNSTLGTETLEGKFVLSNVTKKETVKIGEKEYQAIVVTGKDLKVKTGKDAKGVAVGLKYYFAENVGMVRQELTVGGNKVTFDLDRYEPKPKK